MFCVELFLSNIFCQLAWTVHKYPLLSCTVKCLGFYRQRTYDVFKLQVFHSLLKKDSLQESESLQDLRLEESHRA